MSPIVSRVHDGELRVLVLVFGDLGGRVAGPAIRGWAIARALARRHRVTVAAPGGGGKVVDGISTVPLTRRRLLREALRHDVVVAPCVPPYLLALKAARPLLVVSDQYDPVDLELGTLADPRAGAGVRTARRARALQLDVADIVTCAGERQRERLEEEIDAVGGDRPRLAVVPFGLPDPPPRSSTRPLRERFGQIGPRDTVVLWWGSIWRWLDAEAAIRAWAPLAAARPDIKLVLTAGRPPRTDHGRLAATDEARALARTLGLLDRTVLFLDDWVAYEDRHAYLAEADVGLTLHRDTDEAPLAARARYMDYLWTGLPCVLTRGDETAAALAAAGLATLVAPHDPDAVRRAVLRLADDAEARERAAAGGRELAARSGWQAAVAPLVAALDDARGPRRPRPRAAGRALAGAAAYYGRRVDDHLIARRRAPRGRRRRAEPFIVR